VSIGLYLPDRRSQRRSCLRPLLDHREGTPLSGRSTGFKHCSTASGSCSYDLGSDPVGGTAVATGDVEVTNTGNVATIDHVKITWPQEGYAPLAMTRDVRVKAGATKDVEFHMPLTSDELDNLQNWHATITSWFGPVS
jgi:hypothetical protein